MEDLILDLLKQSPLLLTLFISFYILIRKDINGVAKRLDSRISNIEKDIKDIKENHLSHIEKDIAIIQEKLK
jgi:hypothetical protein